MAWPPQLSRRGRAAVTALAVALAVSACTGARPRLADKEESTTTTGASTSTTTTPVVAEVAQAKTGEIDVYADATADAPIQHITAADATAAPNIPLVFLVKSSTDDRLEVHLPVPPSGGIGWVRRADVTVSSVPFRIEVALAAHRVRVFERGTVALDEPAGIGTTDRPAPGTGYYLKELLQPPSADGPYGAYAYSLSGFTTELESFTSGTGLVGIHGTNDPTGIGQDTPSGSIRLSNDVVARMVNDLGLPLGTPVEIVP